MYYFIYFGVRIFKIYSSGHYKGRQWTIINHGLMYVINTVNLFIITEFLNTSILNTYFLPFQNNYDFV